MSFTLTAFWQVAVERVAASLSSLQSPPPPPHAHTHTHTGLRGHERSQPRAASLLCNYFITGFQTCGKAQLGDACLDSDTEVNPHREKATCVNG